MALPNFDLDLEESPQWLDDIGDVNELLQQVEDETETFIAESLAKEIFDELDEPQPKRAIAQQPAGPARFAEVSDKDLENLRLGRTPQSTMAATKKWLSTINYYQKRKGIALDFATGGNEQLASFLRGMYVELRQKNGQPYSRSSLLGCRAAIQSHLRILKRKVNIFTDSQFQDANETLDGHLKAMKRQGQVKPVQHKATITSEDMAKLALYFKQSDTDPVVLTEAVWFLVTFHFCLRAREIQSLLRVSDLEVKKDDNGSEYVVLSTAFAQKNYQGGSSDSDAVSAGRIQSPEQVAAVKLLIRKLNPKHDRLFQMACKRKPVSTTEPWYTGQPLGKNTMAVMMTRISEKAKLSQRYTNHCIRASVITRLTEAEVAPHVIMATSLHKSVQSLSSFNQPTEAAKKSNAAILDAMLELPKLADEENCAGKESSSVPLNPASTVAAPTAAVSSAPATSTTEGSRRQLEVPFQPTFQNCSGNVSIVFNMTC